MSATDRDQAFLTFHGAVILLLGLLAGLPAVSEELAGSQPTIWRASHGALLLAGVWLIATGAVLPVLRLPAGQGKALRLSLTAAGYAFTTAVLIQASTGVRALTPHGTWSSWVAYLGNLATVACGMLAAILTIAGAWGATRGRDTAG